MSNTPKPQANILREKVINAVCFKPGIIGYLEQFERIEALITEARIDEVQNFIDFFHPDWSKDMSMVVDELKDRLTQLKEKL